MRARLLALVLATTVAGGCAMKKDVRLLQTEVEALRAAQQANQQALIQEIRRQNALLLDSVTIKDVRLRGDVLNRLVALDRQLVQIQELTGQSQQGLAVLRQELRQREEALRAATAGVPAAGANPTDSAAEAAPEGTADEMYAAGREALQRGSLSTARSAFEGFLRAYPRDARAADAQLGIGETYERAKDTARALDAYQRVLELFPNSSRAPTALLRAARLELDRGNRERGRSMLNQLVTAYPRSPEAADAKKLLTSTATKPKKKS